MAMPISPEGHDWLEEFNLIQPFNLPDIKNPLKRGSGGKRTFDCSLRTGQWFSRREYGFTPHDLRHAYNHRGHLLGYNPKVLADSLGHSMQMNGNNYLRHMGDSVKLEGMVDAIKKDQNKRSELEASKDKIVFLKAEITSLKNEIELLRTTVKMYKAIEKSRGTNSDNKLL